MSSSRAISAPPAPVASGTLSVSGASRQSASETLVFSGILALIWAAFWLAGLPRPNVDDAFFAGIAVHLAQHGEIANPWCVGWLGYLPGVSAEPFLVQPPIYPVALAGWLRVFGVSTASLTAWICTLGFAASVCLWRLLRAFDVGRSAALLGTMIAGGWILQRGLRPEAFTLLCLAGGQLFLLRRRDFVGAALGGALNGLAVLAHPFWIVFAAPGTALHLWDARARREPLPALAAGIATGIAAAFLVLLAIVGRHFGQLVHDIGVHAQFVSATPSRLATFFEHLRVGYDGYVRGGVLALAFLAWLAAPARGTRRARMGLFFVAACGALGLALYPGPCAIYLVLVIAAVPLLLTAATPLARATRVLPAAVLVGWFGVQHTVQALADRADDDPALRARVRAYIDEARPEQVVFDAATLRTVFDYRPPAGTVDLAWAWSPGRSTRWQSAAAIGPRDLWVVNPMWSRRQLGAIAPTEPFRLGGRPLASVTEARRLTLLAGRDLPAPVALPLAAPPSP